MASNPDIIVAITLPLMLASTIICILVFLYKSKTRKLESLVKIVELTGNVDPETVKALGSSNDNYKSDYRRGLIWLAIGIPLSLGMLYDEGLGAAVFGLIPVLIGVALLISGKYRWRED